MPYFERTEEEIVSSSLARLSEHTNITQLSPGAKARFFIETFSREQGLQHDRINTNLMQAFIAYADTRFLDYFGDMLNLPRREATNAATEDNNFMFYVETGTFGDINANQEFIIYPGQVVSTVPYSGEIITPGIEEQTVVEYRTIQQIVCPPDQSFAYGPIRSLVEGSASNIPRGVLNRHTYQNYNLSDRNLLKCTNRYAISTGDDRESDDSYRFRLTNIFRARQTAILAAIRLAALVVPGVSNVETFSSEQGPGSFSVYVTGLTPTPGPRLLRFVSQSVGQVSAFGIRPFVLAPEPIGVEFVAAVSWSSRATREEKALGYASMRDSLEDYMNNISQGDGLLLQDTIDLLLAAGQPYINSIGYKVPNNFEEVYAYRRDPSTEGVTRSIVVGDAISPLYNERVILETSGKHRGIQFLTV